MDWIARIWEWIAGALAALAALVGIGGAPPAPRYQGYVEAEFVRVASPVGGVLERIEVTRGGRVATGQPLFVLESGAERAQVAEATARLAQARARHADLLSGRRAPEIEAIIAQRGQAEANMRLARINLERQQGLRNSPAFARERLDEATAQFDQWTARVAELDAQIETARMIGREAQIAAAAADVEIARATLDQAQWRLDQKTIAAAVGGMVADTMFRPGENVPAGAAIVSILPPENRRVRFFVPQAEIARVQIGAAVRITCDGCQPIDARVTFVSPQAEFTPPVLYNRENRQRMVFMIEARADPPTEALRPGQPVDVEVRR